MRLSLYINYFQLSFKRHVTIMGDILGHQDLGRHEARNAIKNPIMPYRKVHPKNYHSNYQQKC